MTNNDISMENTPTLAQFSQRVSLVEVRQHPELYPRIKDTILETAYSKMAKIVYAAVLYRGQVMQAPQISFIAEALVSEILADTTYGLPFLSWTEIGMVVRNAVLSKDMYGVSVATIYSALVEYAKMEGHEACKQVNK